ncbi:MAG: c-type cytochrome [Magnetococcales bacterium]|nr:c-type cytochrome [Magnetococcales bacterium]
MKIFLQVAAFSLFVIGMFGGYSNFGIPQITPAPPPVEEKIDLTAMDMDGFIALGERTVNGKGTCKLCHNELGRAPMLEKLGSAVGERLADSRYAGEASDAEGYLMESLVDPSAYVVAGFGKAGTNDTVSPMPDVSGGSIGLSEPEILATIAYMQDSNGMEVTVEIPDMSADEEEEEEEAETREVWTSAEEVLEGLQCGMCHLVADGEGDMGPDLRAIGGKVDKAYLRRAIMDPNADVAEGFEADMMPPDYGEQLYAVELDLLVDYLAGLK